MLKERHSERENSSHSIKNKYLGERAVEAILEELGIHIVSQTSTRFQILCPYHDNKFTSAATVDKDNGFLYCFGAGCDTRMSIIEVVKDIKGIGHFPALRFIKQFEGEDVLFRPEPEIEEEVELPVFDVDLLARLQKDFWESDRAKNYIRGRNISKASAIKFGLGYDKYKDMVATPMFDNSGVCVGAIYRSIEGKAFKNSFNLPTSKTLFGIHIAKSQNTDEVVVCESNFDAILSDQAGHPAVATLGGTFNKYHVSQLARYFNKVVIAVDNEDKGHAFAERIGRLCKKNGLYVYRMQYSEYEMLPGDVKDFGECRSMEEIDQSIRNACSFMLD